MADTLDFENILKIVKENNPKVLENWKNKKISGAKTLFNSKFRKKIVDEIRFKLKGGIQISFVGDEEQEKLIKIVGGKAKAQKTLSYIQKHIDEKSNSLSEEDLLIANILIASIEKYITVLEIKQKERDAKKVKLPTIEEMEKCLSKIDSSDKKPSIKSKEKEEYLRKMLDSYQKEYDKLKYKLEGVRLKINDKTIITKQGKNGFEITNYASLSNIHEEFQALKTAVYNQGLTVNYIDETLRNIKQSTTKPKSQNSTMKPFEIETTSKQSEIIDSELSELRFQSEQSEETKELSDIFDFNTQEQKDYSIYFEPIKIDGKVAYNFGRYRDKYNMKKLALEIDQNEGKRKTSFLTNLPFVNNIIAFLPNKSLKASAIEKLSNEQINLASIYGIYEVGEIRLISQRKQTRNKPRIQIAETDSSENDYDLDKMFEDFDKKHKTPKIQKTDEEISAALDNFFVDKLDNQEETASFEDEFFK